MPEKILMGGQIYPRPLDALRSSAPPGAGARADWRLREGSGCGECVELGLYMRPKSAHPYSEPRETDSGCSLSPGTGVPLGGWRTIGRLAAPPSSSRRTGVEYGAF